ncbi:hypothetical protein JCM10450v2_005902 [Rhodotorula kratochvilovae]
MSRPAPLLLGGYPAAAQDELTRLHLELDEARNVVNGAQALARVLGEQDDASPHSLPDALQDELARAQDQIPRLEDRIRILEVHLAAAVPTPLSPAPPPPSAVANGFDAHTPSSYGTLEQRTPAQSALERVQFLLSRMGQSDDVGERVRAMDEVVEAVEHFPALKLEVALEDHLPSIMACLADSAGKDVRAATYRLMRHLLVDASDAFHFNEAHLPLFLVRSLARDAKHEQEKTHVLRLVRALLTHAGPSLGHGSAVVPVAVLRGVVALAETPEEKLRLAALETLGELVIRNLPLLVACEGLRVVLQTLADGPYDLAPFLALAFLSAVDHPETRQWLRPGVDVEVILAGFTEVQGKGASVEERVRASATLVAMFLQSWSGLFYLNIHGRQALTSLVDSLTNPSQVIRETLLDMLFDVFNVKTPAWYASRDGQRSSFSSSRGVSSAVDGPAGASQQRTNLIDQFMAVLLLIFIEAGLIEALASLAADPKDPSTAAKVSLLIGEILTLSNRVLPPAHAVRVQALPKLFALTAAFDTSRERLAASEALGAVGRFERERGTQAGGPAGMADSRARANSLPLTPALALASHSLPGLRASAAQTMDDLAFRNLLLESGVLSSKEEARWNPDALFALVRGPLRSGRRVEEANRATKWMRRVLAFYHPAALRYSDLPVDPSTEKWTALGCDLVATLVATPEGVQVLAEDKLLRQLSESLFQLDATSGTDVLLTKDRVEGTLAGGYFAKLGVLSRSPDGIRLLDQFKFWTAFYRVAEMRNREDLVRAIIENMDYTTDGHTRVFLSKALTSSYKHIRLFATRHLSTLISASPSLALWQIHLLVQQLYDSAPEVVSLAISILSSACASLDVLRAVVALRPALEVLPHGEADALLMLFLAVPEGVRYLDEIGWIEQELEGWFQERNLLYMVELELALAAALKTDGGVQGPSSFDGTPPSHLYGELARTAEGCEILRDSGHLDEFVDVVQAHEESALEQGYVIELKSVLWAVGHIGATPYGLAILDEYDVLTDLVKIAAFSPVYSLRGTATYALAFISSTEEGAEMLDELGWESVFTPLRGPTGICVPMYLSDYIFTPLWDPPLLDLPGTFDLPPSTSSVEREALTALANLSNHILATKASRALARLKARHPALFASPALYARAGEMLASHHYRLAVRRYVLELFELELDPAAAERVARAGEELKARGRARALDRGGREELLAAEVQRGMGGGFGPAPWAISRAGGRDGEREGVGSVLLGGMAGGGASGEGGEVTDEDEDEDESSGGEAETTIPLKTLTPLVTVRGFLLA